MTSDKRSMFLGVLILLSVSFTASAHSILKSPEYDEDRLLKFLLEKDFDVQHHDPEMVIAVINFVAKAAQFRAAAQKDVTPKNQSEYDFIVVGVGTAGSAVTSRLSEVAEANVLAIEAGVEESLFMGIPLSPAAMQMDKRLNWDYKTERSENYCLGMVNEQCKWPRGKVMGGSSVLNYMIATRGAPADFDHWAELGNEGWSYNDVLEFFKKLENMVIPDLRGDTKYHGTDGPVSISYGQYRTEISHAFLEAAKELDFPIGDYNGERLQYAFSQSTTVNGTRMSGNRAYLHNRFRQNLHVTKYSQATKVLIDPTTKQARGVQFIKNGKEYTVYARKEVILCAGAIGSAQLLMLSGVGPADHLKELGIPVIKDAPVGQNLQDHLGYMGLTYTVDKPVVIHSPDILNASLPYIREYLMNQTGPFSVPGGVEGLGFNDAFHPGDSNAPANIEQIFFGTTLLTDPTLTDAVGLKPEITELFTPLEGKYTWSMIPMLLKPKSRGWLKLRSSNIHDKPIINANYFDHPDDIQTLIAGVNVSMLIGQTEAMKRYNSKLFEFEIEGCKQYKGDFNKHMECMLRHLSMTIYHYCGTCKMGPESDPTAVVNPKLQVIGVKGLRVADASIMPEIVSLHPTIPIYMIGEKLSHMVKEHWGYLQTV